MHIIADIGGTNIRFEVVETIGSITHERSYKHMKLSPKNFVSLSATLTEFMHIMNINPNSVHSFTCAVPGHVLNNTASMSHPEIPK